MNDNNIPITYFEYTDVEKDLMEQIEDLKESLRVVRAQRDTLNRTLQQVYRELDILTTRNQTEPKGTL